MCVHLAPQNPGLRERIAADGGRCLTELSAMCPKGATHPAVTLREHGTSITSCHVFASISSRTALAQHPHRSYPAATVHIYNIHQWFAQLYQLLTLPFVCRWCQNISDSHQFPWSTPPPDRLTWNWTMVLHMEPSLQLNPGKCHVLKFMLGRAVPIPNQLEYYYLLGNTITYSNFETDLGLVVQCNLSWSEHYKKISAKAYNSLHLIRRTLSPSASVSLKKTLYITLVWSHLTYCSQLWRPRFLKDIANLERIQRRSTKYILRDYTSNYKERLTTLNLLPLMYWYDLQDLKFLLKCMFERSRWQY